MTDPQQSVRYQRLEEIANRSLRESTRHLTLDELKSCYPKIASTDRGRRVLEKALAQFSEIWHRSATKEFNSIFEERDIQKKFVELEQVIQNAQSRFEKAESNDPLDPSSGPVHLDKLSSQNIVQSNITTLKKHRLETLRTQLEQINQENIELEKKLREVQNQQSVATDGLAACLDDLQQSVQSGENLPNTNDMALLAKQVVPSLPESPFESSFNESQ